MVEKRGMPVHQQDDVTVIGVINEECQSLLRTIEPFLTQGRRSFVFNMAQASFLNSVNIAAIIATRNKIAAAGGKVAVSNLSNNIKAVFRILRLERLFDLELDLDGAVRVAKS